LDRFLRALFSGVLLPARVQEVLYTLPPKDVLMLDGTPARYSMGLQTAKVNGVTFWGKTGEWTGYRTRMFSTRDQQRRFVLTCTPIPLASPDDMTPRVVAALTQHLEPCQGQPAAGSGSVCSRCLRARSSLMARRLARRCVRRICASW
ncbi:MAG TPA: hypothetical protein VGO89_16800, partial [Streptomyces sp.]|nr:hypothetical protein [Streptomyces sp.]